MRYLPHTADDIRSMLEIIGAPSVDTLFEPIPEANRLKRPLAIESSLDEASLMDELSALADQNTAATCVSFLGGGIYDHHVPPAVDQLLLRGEFYTAYTPYQAEVAQGTLQAIFEFQTIVAELFGMPVANASMYDGASALAEAVLMARRLTKRTRVVICEGVHPEYLEVVRTYVGGLPGGAESITTLSLSSRGTVEPEDAKDALGEDGACLVVGYPSFYGTIYDLHALSEAAHERGALLVTVTQQPYALGIVEPPGSQGADISVGEGQAPGVPAQYGGPGCGLFACRDARAFLQNIPGRLVGETVDRNGQRGYVLTLSTREQHIRRDRATSNICTNHSLCALAITIRACLLGKRGLVEVARHCLSKSEYVKNALVGSGAYELPYSAPTFNEFVVRRKAGAVAPLVNKLASEGILAGIPLSRFDAARDRDLLVCVTERRTRAQMDRLIAGLLHVSA